MTIRLPSIGEQLAPSMEGIGSFLKNIANPNYDQQAALREALLSGRIDPQTLVDMGGEEVEKRFGKGTAHYASGNKSLKSKIEGLKGTEIQSLLQLPENDPRRQEFISTLTGIKDPTERKIAEQNVQIGGQNITRNQQDIESAEQKLARETENRVTVNRAISRVGGKENLYSAYQQGKLSSQELQALHGTPEYDEVFKFQRDDYWKKQEMDFREKTLNERTDPYKNAKEYNLMLARKIVDTTSKSNTLDVNMVLEDRSLEKMYEKPVDEKTFATMTPTQQKVYEAVQAVKMNRKMESDDRKRLALEYFRKQTAGISSIFRDQKRMQQLGDAGVQAQVDQYNQLAYKLLGGYFDEKDIPQIAFDEKGPRSKDAGFAYFDAKTMYQTQGVPAFEGEGTGTDIAPKVDPIDQIAADVFAGKANLDDQMKLAPDVASANRLKVKVEQLRAEKLKNKSSDSTTVRPGRTRSSTSVTRTSTGERY